MTQSNQTLAPDFSHPHTALGAMVWLMSHSPYHRKWGARAINVDIMPAIVLNQFRLYHDADGNPVGFATWAFTTQAVREGLIAGTHILRFDDWRAGDQVLFNDFVAPWGHGAWIVNDMRNHVFPDLRCSHGYSLARNPDGSIRKVYCWRGKTKAVHSSEQPGLERQARMSDFSAGALKTRVLV